MEKFLEEDNKASCTDFAKMFSEKLVHNVLPGKSKTSLLESIHEMDSFENKTSWEDRWQGT